MDILYVTSGTTAGLRQADAAMRAALASCGVSTVSVTASFSPPGRLRPQIYGSLLRIDVYEGLAIRRAIQKATRRFAPRAVMYATSHAALLRPAGVSGRPAAIRFDTPAQLSRIGRRYGLEHRLEQRRFSQAEALLPWGLDVDPEIARVLPPGATVIPLPVPVPLLGPPAPAREPLVVAYAGSPGKKGLDVVAGAWHRAATGDRRLVITGLSRSDGVGFLAQHGIPEPPGTEWTGLITHDEFRALTRRAEIYLAASTYENYGLAQLEALVDGALLVTTASAGPFPALAMARDLAPGLVARERSADGLRRALAAAVALPDADRRRYRERAVGLVEGLTGGVLEERLRTEVLPTLLG